MLILMLYIFSKRKFRGRNHLKTTWLVTPKDNWPPVGKSGTYFFFFLVK